MNEEIIKLCDKLSLPKFVMEKANSILEDSQYMITNGVYVDPIYPACVYGACRILEIGRTLNEISDCANIKKQYVAKKYNEMIKNEIIKVLPPCPLIYLSKIVNNMKIPIKIERDAVNIIQEIKNCKFTQVDPNGLSASALYVACIKNGYNATQDKIASVCGCSTATIRNNYKRINEVLK